MENERIEPPVENSIPAAPDPSVAEGSRPAAKKGRRRLLAALGLLALAVLSWLLWETVRLNRTLQTANELAEQGDYAQALDAYARLASDGGLRFYPFARIYTRAGADGAAACEDILEEQRRIEAQQAAEDQRRRAEEERQAAEAARQQTLLAEAMTARAEGRLEEALALAEASRLGQALAEEIRADIEKKRDEDAAARALAALEGLDLPGALALAEEVRDPDARQALQRQLRDGWAQKRSQMQETYRNTVFAGAWYSLVLGETPRLVGDRRYEGLAAELRPGDAIVVGAFSWMRLTDGRVELMGDTLGAAETAAAITDAVGGALGLNHGLVVRRDGTVTNLGASAYGRDAVADWTDIAQVAAGAFHSLGLRADGTVAAAGLDLDGQCQVDGWTDAVAVAAGLRHSVALTGDGRVLAAGDNSFGQCDVSGWKNVVAVRCGGYFTLGLTADGRLLAAGDNGCGQCDVSGWSEVVAFDAGLWHTVALLGDGRVVTAGTDDNGQRALEGLRLFETGAEGALAAAPAQKATEFVYTGDGQNGPWLYCSQEGCVIVTFDEGTGKIKATRADLICTWGHPPLGILAGGGDKPGDSVRATRLARQNRAVFALTGDYYTMHGNAKGILIRRGNVIRDRAKTLGCAFFPDGSLGLVDPAEFTAQDLIEQGVRDAWVFGPVLISGDELQDFSRHSLARKGEITMRTILGSYCPYHHLAAAYGFSTLRQAAEDMLACGCTVAYNLDGGRSSMMVFMGEIVNKTAFVKDGWRGLRDMVGFLTSDLVPEP